MNRFFIFVCLEWMLWMLRKFELWQIVTGDLTMFIEHDYSFLYHFKIIFSFLISYIVGFSYKKLFVYDEMYNQFSW